MDDADYEALSKFKWCFNGRYAVRPKPRPMTGGIRMHREIIGTPVEKDTDHINGDKLDNRRSNLRVCTRSQNMANVGKLKNNSSGFKGIHWHVAGENWIAYIKINGKKRHLGCFADIKEAAQAYNEAAKQLFGEFANLNKV